MQRRDTFATPVWVDDLVELAPHRERWAQCIRELRQRSPERPERTSNRIGWRSDSRLLDDPEFALLQQRLLVAVKAVLADYGARPGSMALNLHGWANVHDRGGYNIAHVHEGCLLSGTVYLVVPPGAGEIFFTDPRPAALMEHFERTEEALRKPVLGYRKFSIAPRELQLVIFPSWLTHGVEPCDSAERISVAFNIQHALRAP